MALLEVNNNRISFQANNYLNIKSLIPKVQKEFPINNYKLNFLQINGEQVDFDSENPILIRPINDSDVIKIMFQERIDSNLPTVLIELTQLHDLIIKKIKLISEHPNPLETSQLKGQTSKIIQAVEVFIQSVNFVVINANNNISDLPIKQLQIHLLSILKAMCDAQKNNDYIMLADLLEYELKDNLVQWKILVLPTLKAQMNHSFL